MNLPAQPSPATIARNPHLFAQQKPQQDAPEKVIQQMVREYLASLFPPCLFFHGSMAHRTFRTPGEPDFVALLPNGRTVLIECKTRTGKLSNEQLGVKAQAEALGHVYVVVRAKEDLEQVKR
jgi:hypothetical protein